MNKKQLTNSDNVLVYSTDIGRIQATKPLQTREKSDGIVRIQKQTSGRKGKGVCVITGLDMGDLELAQLAAELKKKLGTGGSLKEGIIEIQGDKRELIQELLVAKGFKVKLSGG